MFSKETYQDRRQRLKDEITSGVLLFMGNEESPMNYTDNCYHFRQDSNFLYFFGIDQPGLIAAIDVDSGEEILFGNELSVTDIVWIGPQVTLKEQADHVGVHTVQALDRLSEFINNALQKKRKVHYLPPYRGTNKIKLSAWLNLPVDQLAPSGELIKAIVVQRAIKSGEEFEQMAEAVNVSRKLHLMAREMCHSGVVESRVCGVLHEIVIGEGGNFAYPPIVTVNGQTLHNHYYGNTLEKGNLLLVDAGAEVASRYAGDITRTFPVDGQFSQLQKEVYQIVLDTENQAIERCRPGITYAEVHRLAMIDLSKGLKELGILTGDPEEIVAAGAHALFCPHGLGHMIGLDVHDMEDLGEDLVGYDDQTSRSTQFGTKALRLGRTLEEGFALTVEPGIYFIPELIDIWEAEKKFQEFISYKAISYYRGMGGIRIEDNVRITASGREVIGKPIPKTIEEIQF